MMSTLFRRLLPTSLLGGVLVAAALPLLTRAAPPPLDPAVLSATLPAVPGAEPPAIDPALLAEEKARIEVIDKVRPSVVAVFDPVRPGGGSGVLISEDGYALTNYHVVEQFPASGGVSRCGLPDGVLYDCVL